MKANIEVQDRREADAIREGLADPTMRALVVCLGALRQLPSDRARKRVIEFVMDRLEEWGGPSEPPTPSQDGGQS